LLAAGVAVLVAYPLVQALFEDGDLSVIEGLGAAVLGALTTLAAFLAVSYVLRAPELSELRRKG
jgi:hypothetical protein